MESSGWRELLTRWNSDLLSDPELIDSLPPEAIASGWLGTPGATEEQLTAAEMRLGTSLPPSYREFLKISNGWLRTGQFIYHIWGVEDTEWFDVRNRSFLDTWDEVSKYWDKVEVTDEDYFTYGSEQNPGHIRPEYMRSCLEVSEWGDSAVYLLNPTIVTSDGEWEAWFYASWLTGADRYRSFYELMQGQYQEYWELRHDREGTDPDPQVPSRDRG